MRTFPHVFLTFALGLGCSVGAELDEERAGAATPTGGRAGAASSGGTAGATGAGGGGGNAGSAGDSGANLEDGRGGAGGTNGDGASDAARDSPGGGAGSGGNGGTGGECSGADNCNTACAKTGESCAGDCDIACGFNGIGNKHCTCMGGVYIQCPCPRPSDFRSDPIARYCDDLLGGDGMMASYKDLDCATEWEACVARDPNTGTPRGCVCMQDPDADLALRWSCGSTNKWFGPEPI